MMREDMERIGDMIADAQATNQKIECIKQVRMLTGCGLIEAKTVVEALWTTPTHKLPTDGTFYAMRYNEQGMWTMLFANEPSYFAAFSAAEDNCEHDDVMVVKVVAKTKRTLVNVEI